ncbi:MAG: hormogonium polysaccharide biosynthesis glycosyltransferase HpsE [Leptolyngbyaceae cyanobacterium]
MVSSDALQLVNSGQPRSLLYQPSSAQHSCREDLSTDTIDLTIAIPTYNGGDRLPVVLERLLAQVDTASLIWEVIVADNNSRDNTAAVVRQYQQKWPQSTPLRYAFVAEQGAAFARQRAVTIARGRIVAFLDDDNVPAEDWVSSVHRFAVENPEAGAFGSQIHGDLESPLPKELKHFACFLAIVERGSKPRLYEPEKKILPPGAGLAVRRSAWLQHVPKRLFLNHKGKKAGLASEDLEAVLHIQKAGWEIWYNPEMVVYHRIPSARLQASYLRSLLRCVGLSRFYIRMLGTKEWQRPFAIPAYIANDLRRLALHYLQEGFNTTALSSAASCKREYLHSSAVSPFFLVKKAAQSQVETYLERTRFPKKAQYLEGISQALEEGTLHLYSQPVMLVSGQSQRPFQNELLVRFTPYIAAGLLQQFWMFAEHHNLAGTIDRRVITKVFHDLGDLKAHLPPLKSTAELEGQTGGGQYSLNLSQNSVLDAQLPAFIDSQLSQQGLSAANICFEIQTAVALAHPQATRQLTQALQEIGCAVTLDSFGLQRIATEQMDKLHVNFIKLNPRLLNSEKRYIAYARQVSDFLGANQQAATVIAKGIENARLLEKTHDLGIRYAQGYQLSKPQVWSADTALTKSLNQALSN